MNCTSCGTPGTAVVKTMDSGNTVRRRRICPCGYQETTKETPEKGSGAFMSINDRGQRTLVARGRGGDIDLVSDSSCSPVGDPDRVRAGSEARANSHYSDEFETCWKAYGRKEEKVKAFARWKVEAKLVGGELVLRDLVIKALAWQGPAWARDGWRFAKYFERYLKAHKWDDEPLPTVGGARRSASKGQSTVENLAEWARKQADREK